MGAAKLLLRGLRWWSQDQVHRGDLRIRRGRIAASGSDLKRQGNELVVELPQYLALPGLINAHDHLGLDLMPALGQPPYRSFYRWAEQIYRPDESPLREILSVDEHDRLLWGGYRNLCSGATTVVHHDPYRRRAFSRHFPVQVPRIAWSHSLGYAKNLTQEHRRAGKAPWVVHAAEGLDERAQQEVDQLEEQGLLGPHTILVHGIGITGHQQKLLERKRVGLVWCPASNRRLYGATASVDQLQKMIPVVLGTDSTLSGSATLLDEIRAGFESGLVSARDLLAMVTKRAAALFDLDQGQGRLEPGGVADLLLLEDDGSEPADQLLAATPKALALVLVGGQARLANEDLAERLGLGCASSRIDGQTRWLAGDLAGLRLRIANTVSTEILSQNPLWSLMQDLAHNNEPA